MSVCALLTSALAFLDPPLISGRAAVHTRSRPLRLQYDQATYNPEQSGLNVGASNVEGRPDGCHGTGYRFMPLVTASKTSSPAIICLAGAYPGLTAEQFATPRPLPFAVPGTWNYHMLTNDAAPGGFVAIEGSDLLDRAPDTVGVVCASGALGIEFPDGNEHEVLALFDRGDPAVLEPSEMDPKSFYALADPQGNVVIRWIDALPEGWTILGALLYTQMPFVKRAGSGGGFAEMSDEFEF